MKWYVVLDEGHTNDWYAFETEEEAIKYINQCEIMEYNIAFMFYGQLLEYQVTQKLIPKEV